MSNIPTDTVAASRVGHYHPSPPARHVGSLQPMDMDAAWIEQHQQKSSKYYNALSFCDVTYICHIFLLLIFGHLTLDIFLLSFNRETNNTSDQCKLDA